MRVRINGREENLPDGLVSLQELVENRGLVPERVVVEVNLQVISREDWPTVRLQEEDSIEIVSFVGGG
ncbi:sulfur carrier protein [Syntrophus gentianae]|uniref:Sulfur carrier protein n=1 Tax=Syntrophus gentianae TaxID=43775 RepID=A0A1H7YAP5_9BACT|nr:sulfur carrier protein ThiS [Syntrophus gentianae]SEM43306.1 sulfur carrier protein [Syntrophus gentianae]